MSDLRAYMVKCGEDEAVVLSTEASLLSFVRKFLIQLYTNNVIDVYQNVKMDVSAGTWTYRTFKGEFNEITLIS